MASSAASFFFFKQKTAYEISSRDWSSDVCSSDLLRERRGVIPARQVEHAHVVARVDVERRQHGICLQRHRQEEPGTVGLPLRMQGHHPVVESRGPLLGGHL